MAKATKNDSDTNSAMVEYKPGTAFPGRLGRTIGESSPAWPKPLRAKEGAPNVLFIVLDDTGFGQIGCYGSPINTPNTVPFPPCSEQPPSTAAATACSSNALPSDGVAVGR